MVSKYLALNKKVSVIYAETTELIKYVKKIQNLTSATTNIMAKFYTVSSIMALSDIKEESDELVIQINGEKTGLIYSSVKLKDNNVLIKGFIENSKIDIENSSLENYVPELVGNSGSLAVVKNNKYTKLGYKGITPLISGNIVDDFKSYYEKSTQKPAFIEIEFEDNDSNIKCAGFLITFMPDATDNDIKIISDNLKKINFKLLLESNSSTDDLVKTIIGSKDLIKLENDMDIKYFCDCSKDKYKDMLYSLKKSDIESLLEDENGINIVCDYCNKSYDFTKKELENILNKLN